MDLRREPTRLELMRTERPLEWGGLDPSLGNSARSRRLPTTRPRHGTSWRLHVPGGSFLPSSTLLCWIGLGLLVWFGFRFVEREVPATEADRERVLTAHAMAERTLAFVPEPTAERFRKVRWITGTLEYLYSYEPISPTHPTIHATTRFDRSDSRAYDRFRALSRPDPADWGLDEERMRLDEQHGAFERRHTVRAYLVRDGATPVGNHVAAWSGDRTIVVRISGEPIERAAWVAELVEPVIAAVERHIP